MMPFDPVLHHQRLRALLIACGYRDYTVVDIECSAVAQLRMTESAITPTLREPAHVHALRIVRHHGVTEGTTFRVQIGQPLQGRDWIRVGEAGDGLLMGSEEADAMARELNEAIERILNEESTTSP